MNHATAKNTTLNDIAIRINIDRNDSFPLEVRTESKICPPKLKNDKTAMYKIKANISIPDSDELHIHAEADIIFEFDEIPTDYDEVGQKLCLLQAQEIIIDKIGDVMEAMGYKRFDIKVPKES